MKKKTMLATLVMLSLLQGTAFAEDWEADPYGEANISIQSSTFSSEYDNAIINYESNGTFNHWSAFAVLVTGEDSLLKINKVLDATITVTGEMDGYNQTTDKALAGICVKSSGVITVGEKTIVKVVDECDDDNTGEHYKVGVSVEQFDDPDPTFTMGTGESSVTVITNDEGRGFNLYGGKVTGGVLKIDVDTTSGDGVAYGIYAKRSGGNQAEEGSSMNFTDAITMNVKADSNAYGINGELKDKFTFIANEGFDITVTSNSNNAYGMNLVGEKEWGSAIAEAFEIGSGKVTVNGNSAAYGINLDGSFKDGIENKLGTIEFDVDANSGSAYGIQSYANGKLNVAGLSGEITSLTNKAYGVQVQDADSVNFGDSILTVTGAKDTVGFKLNGAFAEGAENDLGNLNLTVSSSGGKADGLAIAANGKYQVESLVAKVTGKNAVNGLSISNSDADVNITNGLNLTAQSTGTRTATALDNSNGTLTVNGAVILNATAADNTAYGISGGKTSTTIFNGAVGIDVAGATNSAAIKAEGSQLNFNNGLKANATNGYSSDVYALQADNATIEATEGDVLLNGNISAKNSANLTFAFNSSNGFTGATERSGESTINLDFKDSSRWDLMGDSALTTLAVAENAVVDMTADGGNYSKLTIDTLNDNGSNGTFKMDIDASTNTDNSDTLKITNHSGTHYIDLNVKAGDTSGAVGTVLASVDNETGSFVAKDKESALFWESYSLDDVENGNGIDWVLAAVEKDDEKGTTSVDTILGANALNYHTWRAENDQLMRRMGELRNNGADEEGAWFRVHGSKINRDDSMSFENKYTTYELGYDQITKQTDDMTRYTGAALSYTDGSSGYESGNGENHSKAIAFYNTDIYSSGHYLDLVFKYANMDNDFNVYDTNNNKISGEYKNTGISVSAEYGRKNDLKNGWYVEPQAQLTLGYFGGDEYETSNGISVDQSGIASVLGRIGFNIGKQIGDSGVIYAKANLLHEFAGDYDIDMYDNAGNRRAESASFNDTWFEYGIGAALKTGKNNHLYFDLAKTAGGDFEKEWTWNAGMRWTF